MGYRFFEQEDLPGDFHADCFLRFWQDSLAGDVGIVLVLELEGHVVGAIGGLVYPEPSTGARVAQEMFWWVEPEHRGRHSAMLIEAFEYVATSRDVVRVLMSAMVGSRDRPLARWYGGRGYRPLERIFVKEV